MKSQIDSIEKWLNEGIPSAVKKLHERHDLCKQILACINKFSQMHRVLIEDAHEDTKDLSEKEKAKYLYKAEICERAMERKWKQYFKACKLLSE